MTGITATRACVRAANMRGLQTCMCPDVPAVSMHVPRCAGIGNSAGVSEPGCHVALHACGTCVWAEGESVLYASLTP